MFKGVSHTAIFPKDFETTLRFYTETLGIKEAFRLNHDDGTPFFAYLIVAPMQFIELLGPDGREPTAAPEAAGYQHLCLEVEDIQAAYDEMRAQNVPIASEIRTGYTGCKLFWILDPDGNRIELMEFPPESMQAAASRRFFG